MHVVFWDTRQRGVAKDFAGGFGVGQFTHAQGLRGRLIRRMFLRDRRPVALQFAYLAAAMGQQGHTVEYVVDQLPPAADVYIFDPALATLDIELSMIDQLLARDPTARILVTGAVACHMPEAFDGRPVLVIQGEGEQIARQFELIVQTRPGRLAVGKVADLDDLPFPNWEPFAPSKFRIGYDFHRFPTAFVELSRGCSLKCDYCPYIAGGSGVRHRSPARVIEEIRYGIARWGFRSFKFRDPLFGLDRPRVLELIRRLGELPRKIQFSIETRLDLLPDELLKQLVEVGLTSITVGIESPDRGMLRDHHRAAIADDRQRAFVDRCRQLGVRTVAGFMVGFIEDTASSIREVESYARWLNPTFANFNVVTPYPGTAYRREIADKIARHEPELLDTYTPVLKYDNLTAADVTRLHSKCFVHYYFRWSYLRANAAQLWPRWGRLIARRTSDQGAEQHDRHGGKPHTKGKDNDRAGHRVAPHLANKRVAN